MVLGLGLGLGLGLRVRVRVRVGVRATLTTKGSKRRRLAARRLQWRAAWACRCAIPRAASRSTSSCSAVESVRTAGVCSSSPTEPCSARGMMR